MLLIAHAAAHVANGFLQRTRSQLGFPDVDEHNDGDELRRRNLLHVDHFECMALTVSRKHHENLHRLMYTGDKLRFELFFALDPLREAAHAWESEKVRPAQDRVDSVHETPEVGATRNIPLEQRAEPSFVAGADVL